MTEITPKYQRALKRFGKHYVKLSPIMLMMIDSFIKTDSRVSTAVYGLRRNRSRQRIAMHFEKIRRGLPYWYGHSNY